MDYVPQPRRFVRVALAAVVVLVGCAAPARTPPRPPALAPPGPGSAVPAINLDAPGRPADQLVAWAADRSPALGIPPVALQAYGYAAASLARSSPGCGIGWATLAGIGSVETRHGSFRGARLDATAVARPPIRGAALDGRPGLAEIRDTDGGTLDGDRVYDRAIGPMQFIPTTWQRWGVDADGDGVANPDDLDDAALAAASYLCASGGALTTALGWQRAVRTYNQSDSYVREVLTRADGYATAATA